MVVRKESVQQVEPKRGYREYQTVNRPALLFDILCRGEVVHGYYADKKKAIRFRVPMKLIEDFEKHDLVKSGVLVPVDELPEPMR